MSDTPLFLAAMFFALRAQAQELPLSTGQFDTLIGVRWQKPTEVFRPDGSSENLDDALQLSNSSFRSISLTAQISYALNQRMLLSIDGPVLRSASLTGESLLLPDITLQRSEQVIGPGDLSLSFSFMPRPNPWVQWGTTVSARAPIGDDTVRLPLGSGFFGGQIGLFGYQSQDPYFVRASISLGSVNSFSPGLFSSIGAGVMGERITIQEELRGVAQLSEVSDVPPEVRQVLTGQAPQKTSLSSVSTISTTFGNLRPLVSLQWTLAGQNEAKGLAYFVGLRVVPKGQGDHSRSAP